MFTNEPGEMVNPATSTRLIKKLATEARSASAHAKRRGAAHVGDAGIG